MKRDKRDFEKKRSVKKKKLNIFDHPPAKKVTQPVVKQQKQKVKTKPKKKYRSKRKQVIEGIVDDTKRLDQKSIRQEKKQQLDNIIIPKNNQIEAMNLFKAGDEVKDKVRQIYDVINSGEELLDSQVLKFLDCGKEYVESKIGAAIKIRKPTHENLVKQWMVCTSIKPKCDNVYEATKICKYIINEALKKLERVEEKVAVLCRKHWEEQRKLRTELINSKYHPEYKIKDSLIGDFK